LKLESGATPELKQNLHAVTPPSLKRDLNAGIETRLECLR
jgi:hypothetical protein